MKWSEQQVAKLKELCNEGKSNKEIASILKCDISHVYNKRSQLKITIKDCQPSPVRKAAIVNEDFDKEFPVVKKPAVRVMPDPLELAFKKLKDELLVTMATDHVSYEDAKVYSNLYETICNFKAVCDKALR